MHPPPLGKFSNLSGYPCISLFHTENNTISYNISSSPIDHYKNTLVIPLLNSLIIQMQDRFADEDRYARHLLCLLPSITVNEAPQLDRMKTFHFSNPLEMRYVGEKHSGN